MELDELVPEPEHVTRQTRTVAAPPAIVWEELQGVTLSALPLSTILIAVRYLPALLVKRSFDLPLDRPFVDLIPIPVQCSEPPSALVFGGLLQPWRPTAGEPPVLDAPALRAWAEPGWVKTAMEFRLTPAGQGTRVDTETRVAATDRASSLLFSGYWLGVRPGSSTIRREVLAAVARKAEARASSSA